MTFPTFRLCGMLRAGLAAMLILPAALAAAQTATQFTSGYLLFPLPSKLKRIAVASETALYQTNDGVVHHVGLYSGGEIGVPDGLQGAKALAASQGVLGIGTLAAITADDSVIIWGEVSQNKPVQNVVSVATGLYSALVATADGQIHGYGQDPIYFFPWDPPYSTGILTGIPTGVNAKKVAIGKSYALALLEDGSITTWGNRGKGNFAGPFTKVVASPQSDHFIALRADGTIFGAGDNGSGQCDAPTVPPGRSVKSLAVADGSSFALLDDGSVLAWGFLPPCYWGYLGFDMISTAGPFTALSGCESFLIGLTPAPTATLTLSQSVVEGGSPSGVTGTITLDTPTNEPLTISLAATGDNPSVLTLPSSVTIASGESTATFQVDVAAVTASQKLRIRAGQDVDSLPVVLLVVPTPKINAIKASKVNVVAGVSQITGTVGLVNNASATVTVELSGSTGIQVPATVDIDSGKSATFPIDVLANAPAGTGTVTATLNGETKTLNLTVNAFPTVTFSALSGFSGQTVNLIVTLSAPVPEALRGALEILEAPGILPGRFTIPAGKKTLTIPVVLPPVATSRTGMMGGNLYGTTVARNANFSVTVSPNTLKRITLPASGQVNTPVTGTIVLAAPVPADTQVDLSMIGPGTITGFVLVPAGSSSVTFQFTPSEARKYTITAQTLGVTKKASITISP